MQNKKISPHQKQFILEKASHPDCSITDLARVHDVSRAKIYSWLKKDKESQINKAKDLSLNNNPFIEVSLINDKDIKKLNLQKASLAFNNFSFVIEGSIETGILLKIIKALEEIC